MDTGSLGELLIVRMFFKSSIFIDFFGCQSHIPLKLELPFFHLGFNPHICNGGGLCNRKFINLVPSCRFLTLHKPKKNVLVELTFLDIQFHYSSHLLA